MITKQIEQEPEEHEECPGHDYEFLENLPSRSDIIEELWLCLNCGHTRVLKHQVGIRD